MAMADKSSVKENKVFAMTLTQLCKSGRNHPKAWNCGRGEVHSPISGDVSRNQLSFLKYCLHSQVALLTWVGRLYCAESIGA
jgi:hypothetical protein